MTSSIPEACVQRLLELFFVAIGGGLPQLLEEDRSSTNRLAKGRQHLVFSTNRTFEYLSFFFKDLFIYYI